MSLDACNSHSKGTTASTFPTLMSIPLAPRTSKNKVTPHLGSFLLPSQQTGTHQPLSQKSDPSSQHRLRAPASTETTTPTQGDGACATSVGDAITSKSPRMLPLQRITLCFNGLATIDFYVVQQQAVRTIHIYTLVVVKACVFEQY